jgi:hypothetical protein
MPTLRRAAAAVKSLQVVSSGAHLAATERSTSAATVAAELSEIDDMPPAHRPQLAAWSLTSERAKASGRRGRRRPGN